MKRARWRARDCTRGRIRTCGETINRRPRCQLRHPGRRADVPPGPHRGASPGRRTSFRSTARESHPAHLLGRQGPSCSDSGTKNSKWSGQRELPPRLRLGKPACLSQHLGHGAPRRTCTGIRRGCSSPPISFGPAEQKIEQGGDGANRTRATFVGRGLANRPVTTPARLHLDFGTHGRTRTCIRPRS